MKGHSRPMGGQEGGGRTGTTDVGKKRWMVKLKTQGEEGDG